MTRAPRGRADFDPAPRFSIYLRHYGIFPAAIVDAMLIMLAYIRPAPGLFTPPMAQKAASRRYGDFARERSRLDYVSVVFRRLLPDISALFTPRDARGAGAACFITLYFCQPRRRRRSRCHMRLVSRIRSKRLS